MIYELPMTDAPSQEFICELGGVKFLFRVQLNVRGDTWTLDVSSSEDEPIVQGIPLVLGADLLTNERFTYGNLFLVDYESTGFDPTANNLAEYGLIWSDDNE